MLFNNAITPRSRTISPPLPKIPCVIFCTQNPSTPLNSGKHSSILHHYSFTFSRKSYKWNYSIERESLYFVQYTEIHPRCCFYQNFVPLNCWVLFYYTDIPQFVYIPSAQRHLGYSQIWMITNKAAITIHMYLFVWTFWFLLGKYLGVRYLKVLKYFYVCWISILGFGAMEYVLLKCSAGVTS